MNVQTQSKFYAAVCDCGMVRHSVRIDRNNLKPIGKTVVNWIRSGYTVECVTEGYVEDHKGACKCEAMAS